MSITGRAYLILGKSIEDYNKINWETASEQNTKWHIVERSDGMLAGGEETVLFVEHDPVITFSRSGRLSPESGKKLAFVIVSSTIKILRSIILNTCKRKQFGSFSLLQSA